MSSSKDQLLSPIVVIEDRYGGAYSGGAWLAVANGDRILEGNCRYDWLLKHGPSDDDVSAGMFWANPPGWIQVGNTPADAIAALKSHTMDGSENWQPADIESDPRYSKHFR